MRVSRLLVAAGVGGIAAPLAAQNSQCAAFSTAQNARQTCDAAIDLTRAYHPIAGLLISGGNAVLGPGSSMGGLGKFAITVRANAAHVVIPQLAVDASNHVAQSRRVLAPAPLIEGAVGLFRGLRGGLLSVDVLGAAQLIPNEKLISDIRIGSGSPRIGPVSLGIGFGARVGVLGERGGLPGVSVSLMRRSVPQVGYGNLGAGDNFAADVKLRATNLRVVASRRFAVLTLSGGAGWSKYSGSAVASFTDPATSAPRSISVELDQSRTLVFADAGLNLGLLKVVGEIGHQSGKDQQLITTFEGFDDTRGTTFFSAGLRFGF